MEEREKEKRRKGEGKTERIRKGSKDEMGWENMKGNGKEKKEGGGSKREFKEIEGGK